MRLLSVGKIAAALALSVAMSACGGANRGGPSPSASSVISATAGSTTPAPRPPTISMSPEELTLAQRGCRKAVASAIPLEAMHHGLFVGKRVDFCLMNEGGYTAGPIPVSRVDPWPDTSEAREGLRKLSPSEPYPMMGRRSARTATPWSSSAVSATAGGCSSSRVSEESTETLGPERYRTGDDRLTHSEQ